MNVEGPLFHKPKSIIAAKNILYATVFLGLITLGINKLSYGSGNPADNRGLVIALVSFALILFLTRQIGLGQKWARTVFLILFILGIALFPYTIVPLFRMNPLLGVLSLLQALLQILALRYLFAKESTHWFNSVHSTVPQ
jgi:hypothetical protein